MYEAKNNCADQHAADLTFVYAPAKSRFAHGAAQLISASVLSKSELHLCNLFLSL